MPREGNQSGVLNIILIKSLSVYATISEKEIDQENTFCIIFNLSSLLIRVMNNASVLGLVEFMLELEVIG